MTELSIEEKAKAYDEALERAKEMIKAMTNIGGVAKVDDIQYIFQLKESEDEKIRNFISNELACLRAVDEKGSARYNELTEAIDWLEKQGEQKSEEEVDNLHNYLYGEQKPADKDEPKFKAGDWVVFNDKHESVYQIEKIENFQYTLRHILGGSTPLSFSHEDMIRKWTIQDAKDGDVLCVKYGNDEMPFIFTGKQDDIAYCALNSFGQFVLSMAEWLLNASVLPATKEQRDLLFAKMKKAGYEWDTNKKELKKIEQSSVWGKDDITRINEIIETLNIVQANRVRTQRMHYNKATIDKNIVWLKSLKERYTWKPSDEQMYNLSEAAHYNCAFFDMEILRGLYDDLKKLRENNIN